MPLPYNGERGEVPVTVGGVDLVLAVEMGKLAQLSSVLKCQSFAELAGRMQGVEPQAVIAGLEILAVRGDFGAAIKRHGIVDYPALSVAFTDALLHHTKGAEGNARAVEEEKGPKASLGGSGSSSPSPA